MGKGPIPDRWLHYLPIGQRIEGTRFIAFKVPLGKILNKNVAKDQQLDVDLLLEHVPNLGIIIDLTNTYRYYSPEDFTDAGIEYQKLMIPGHETPSNRLAEEFKLLVTNFLSLNNDNDKLIGVHCTHGVNRTGYLICNYLISKMEMPPAVAIKKFNRARGHKIERENYLSALHQLDDSTACNDQRPQRRDVAQIRLRPEYDASSQQKQQERQQGKRHQSESRNGWRSSAPQSWKDNERQQANYDGPTNYGKQNRYADYNSHTNNEYNRQYESQSTSRINGQRAYNNNMHSQNYYQNQSRQHNQPRDQKRNGNYSQSHNQNFNQAVNNWRQSDAERSQSQHTPKPVSKFKPENTRSWRERQQHQHQPQREEGSYKKERYSWRRQDS